MTVTDLSPATTTRARAAAVALAATAWFGVLLQLVLSLRADIAGGGTWLTGLVSYLGYFTVLTNAFVAIVATAHATGAAAVEPLRRATVAGCAVTSILLVGLAYHLLLRELWSPTGWQWVADVVLHYVVPLGALAWWFVGRMPRLPSWAPLAWCAYPLAYLAYALLRGEWLEVYPYPFIDVAAIGYGRALANAAGLSFVFVAIGYAVRTIARGPARGAIRAGT